MHTSGWKKRKKNGDTNMKKSNGNMQAFIYGTSKGGSRIVGNKKPRKVIGKKK